MNEDINIQFKNLDEVWRNAHLRRSADLGLWLRQYFEERRRARQQTETKITRTVSPLHHPAT